MDPGRFRMRIGAQLMYLITGAVNAFLLSYPSPMETAQGMRIDADVEHIVMHIRTGQDFGNFPHLPWLPRPRDMVQESMYRQPPSHGPRASTGGNTPGRLSPRRGNNTTRAPRQRTELTNPNQFGPFRTFYAAMRQANPQRARGPGINELCRAAGIAERTLGAPGLFNQTECMQWHVIGRCFCNNTRSHEPIPQERLRAIAAKLQPGIDAFLANPRMAIPQRDRRS